MFSSVANTVKVKEHIHSLIDAILRAQDTLTEWVLTNVKGEYEMRTSLIRKPESKEEEYLIILYILKQLGPGFSFQIKQIEDLVICNDIIKLRRQDKSYGRKDQLLANIFGPLIYMLFELHNEHIGKPYKSFTSLSKSDKDEIDALYY